MPSHIFNLHLDVILSPTLRALESHVFEKVGRAVVLRRLVPAARVDPDADGGGLAVGGLFLGGDVGCGVEGCRAGKGEER